MSASCLSERNNRILVIDDNVSIHEDFKKILCEATEENDRSLADAKAILFEECPKGAATSTFEIDSAYQGEEGFHKVRAAYEVKRPYAMAFVDVRMPPGWDGVETVNRIWQSYPEVQVVICTAYSDYSWDQMIQRIGKSDSLLILKKPFDNIEVLQLAHALTEKWHLAQQARLRLKDLEFIVQERTQELNRAIEHLKAESQRASQLASAAMAGTRAKSEFLANMSHEIRTPMNGVIGMASLLLDTPLSSDQRDCAETIRESAESLLTVVDDILDFSKMESGKMTFEARGFDLLDEAEGVLELLAVNAHKKDLELNCLFSPEVPTRLRGDSSRVRQILTNLIGNAIKFTERGEVLLRVVLIQESGQAARLRFEVEDSGIGIPQEVQSQLFRPFCQADSSTSRRFGGTGLGLAICKSLTELMHGEIGVKSVSGRGSTFWFTLELEKQPDSGLANTHNTHSPLSGARVLIVAAQTNSRAALLHHLESWQATGDCASSSAEALRLLRDRARRGTPCEAALIDLDVPDSCGLALAQEIRSDPCIADTKLVLLGRMGEHFSSSEREKLGIQDRLAKPVRKSKLHDCLLGLLSAAVRDQGVPSGAGEARSKVPLAVPLRVLVADDSLVNQKVAIGQLCRLGHRAEAVPDGRAVLDAMDRDQFDVILMDCQMPGLDGYETARIIRAKESAAAVESGRRVRIVALTAHVLKEDQERCLAAGMDVYLSKPIRMRELDMVLRNLKSA